MIMVGEFLWALDGFLTRLEITARLAIGLVCVAGEYIVVHNSLMIIIFYKNNKKKTKNNLHSQIHYYITPLC